VSPIAAELVVASFVNWTGFVNYDGFRQLRDRSTLPEPLMGGSTGNPDGIGPSMASP
jgi:hypothetical protein